MTRTETTTLTPALATVLRRAPVRPVTGWEPTTLHPSVVRRPAVAGTVPLPGEHLFGDAGAFELGALPAPKHLRTVPAWALAAVLAACVTLLAGALGSVLAHEAPAAPSPR